MKFILLISLITSLQVNCLKIFESQTTLDFKLFFHRSASFGVHGFNRSAELVLFHPILACDDIIKTEETVNTTQVLENSPYLNKVVLILRGECTFFDKIYNAQLLGAVGVIVGDYNNSKSDQWVIMSKEDNGIEITIPAIFIQSNTFDWIHNLLKQNTKNNKQFAVQNNNNNTQAANQIIAMLDRDGEYVEPSNSLWLVTLGIIVVIIPVLWCILITIALLKRKIRRIREWRRRNEFLYSIPMIRFNGVQSLENRVNDDDVTNTEFISNQYSGEQLTNDDMKMNDMDEPDETDDDSDQELDLNDENNHLSWNLKLRDRLQSLKKRYNLLSTNLLFYAHRPFLQNPGLSNIKPHNESCCVCLDDFAQNSELRLLPCHHAFHPKCIDPWLSESSELCPMCKQSIFSGGNDKENSVVENSGWVSRVRSLFRRNESDNDNSNNENSEDSNSNVQISNLQDERSEELLSGDFLH